MTKVDKSQYSKSEWRKIRDERRKTKKTQTRDRLKQKVRDNIELPQSTPKKKPAFVLGNGTSRENISVENLLKKGIVYGCNALYRTHAPHYLIAVDPKMVSEICKTDYQLKHSVWTNRNRSFTQFSNLNYFQPSKGWSSGPSALNLACEHNHSTIYILGFDYRGLADGKKVNNIYADTFNYKRSTDNATFYGNWLRQTKTVVRNNPSVNF